MWCFLLWWSLKTNCIDLHQQSFLVVALLKKTVCLLLLFLFIFSFKNAPRNKRYKGGVKNRNYCWNVMFSLSVWVWPWRCKAMLFIYSNSKYELKLALILITQSLGVALFFKKNMPFSTKNNLNVFVTQGGWGWGSIESFIWGGSNSRPITP